MRFLHETIYPIGIAHVEKNEMIASQSHTTIMGTPGTHLPDLDKLENDFFEEMTILGAAPADVVDSLRRLLQHTVEQGLSLDVTCHLQQIVQIIAQARVAAQPPFTMPTHTADGWTITLRGHLKAPKTRNRGLTRNLRFGSQVDVHAIENSIEYHWYYYVERQFTHPKTGKKRKIALYLGTYKEVRKRARRGQPLRASDSPKYSEKVAL